MSDDTQLIEQALAGQSEAFGQLVLKYQDRLYNTVFHVVGHAEDARDIVQEALVQAFLKLDSFRRDSAFYTWLYRIAFNVAATSWRRRRPTVSVDQASEAGMMDPPDDLDSPVWSARNVAPWFAGPSGCCPTNIGPSLSCARSTAVATTPSPKCSICPSEPSAAGCIGHECNCAKPWPKCWKATRD